MSDARPAESASFGYATVPLDEKQRLVDEVFHRVASRYDIMNDLMSLGLHRLWKDAAATWAWTRRGKPFRHLDVAGGTGDIAFRIVQRGGPSCRSTVLDVNPEMLAVGRARAERRGLGGQVAFVEGNAEDLPFPASSVDLYTIAFGIRNVPRIREALSEAFRVLRAGGRFLCLEFSQPDVPGLDRLYDLYSFKAIPPLGRLVAGDARPYRYLVESIRRFPPRDQFLEWVREAGFRRCEATPLTGGVVAIHSGWKL